MEEKEALALTPKRSSMRALFKAHNEDIITYRWHNVEVSVLYRVEMQSRIWISLLLADLDLSK